MKLMDLLPSPHPSQNTHLPDCHRSVLRERSAKRLREHGDEATAILSMPPSQPLRIPAWSGPIGEIPCLSTTDSAKSSVPVPDGSRRGARPFSAQREVARQPLLAELPKAGSAGTQDRPPPSDVLPPATPHSARIWGNTTFRARVWPR